MEDKEFSSINVIPFVDILLALLTIVLITASFMVQGAIPVNLPKSKEGREEVLKSLEIILTKEGDIFFERKKVSLQELETILKSLSPSTRISLSADREAKVQSLVNLLDLFKKYRLEKVVIRTERSE